MRPRSAVPVALLVLGLAGCAGGPAEEGDAHPPATPEPTATQEPAAAPTPQGRPRFTAPTACDAILAPGRLAGFADDGLELLGGPGGRYGTEYFAEPTPEERVGGLTCVWGDEARPGTTLTVSVAPLDVDTRRAVVDDLLAQGLNELQTGNAISYGEVGDEVSAPCVLNVIRTDSWISVIRALGGESSFMEATRIADEVASLVYLPG